VDDEDPGRFTIGTLGGEQGGFHDAENLRASSPTRKQTKTRSFLLARPTVFHYRITMHLPLLASLFLAPALVAADDGWVNLFNGKDLSNWVNVNCAPETWTVADGVIQCTGKPTGALRTPRMYENFLMEVEWRHMKSGGNAGIFIWSSPIAAKGVPFLRAIEVQVLDNGYGNTASHTTHGDVFPIHGATMVPFGKHSGMRSFPSESRSKSAPEWNHYLIEGRDGVLRLSVNGKEVSGGEKCNWRKGYIGLESEGAPTEWRLIRIKELPGSSAPAAETAPEAQGHRPLYNGLDLRGWKTETPDRWVASDWRLVSRGGPEAKPLWTESEFGDFELIADLKISNKSVADAALLLRGAGGKEARISLAELMPRGAMPAAGIEWGKWNRVTLTVAGRTAKLAINGRDFGPTDLPSDFPAKRAIGLGTIDGEMDVANIYLRDL
jgi:hypothetical protein